MGVCPDPLAIDDVHVAAGDGYPDECAAEDGYPDTLADMLAHVMDSDNESAEATVTDDPPPVTPVDNGPSDDRISITVSRPLRRAAKRAVHKLNARLTYAHVRTMMSANTSFMAKQSPRSFMARSLHRRRCQRRMRTKTRMDAPELPTPSLDPDAPHKLLDYITDVMLNRLNAEDKALLQTYLNDLIASGTQLHVGTGCSGSDVYITMLLAMEWVLTGGRGRLFSHAFSAERDPTIRTFLKRAFPSLRKLFTSIEALQYETALNDVGAEMRAQPEPVTVDECLFIFVAGFVCKDISSLSPAASSFRSACKSGAGKTGSTWHACKAFLKHKQPLHALFENVTALASSDTDASDRSSNLDTCLSDLKSLSYAAVAMRLCPWMFGMPVTRGRIYILASRVLSLVELESVSHGIHAQSLSADADASQRFHLNNFLLNDDHAFVQQEFDKLLEARGKRASASADAASAKSSDDQKWIMERTTPFCGSINRTVTTRYHDALTASPWMDLLKDRELENLSTKPAMTGVAELSQSEKRDGNFYDTGCPCVVPQGIYMHLERLRLLVPLERMALQGITVPPEVYEMFSSEFWNSLSGNSFCAPVLSAITSSLLLVHARKAAVATSAASASAGHTSSSCDDVGDVLMQEALAGLDEELVLCQDLLAELGDELVGDLCNP